MAGSGVGIASFLWIAILVGAALLIGFFALYNSVVRMRQLTRNAWADVDVYLKRRAELIPNLATAVKAYASHEAAVLEALATARSQALAERGPTHSRADAESTITQGLGKVFMLAENYPDLKASDNFLNLQRELSETESKIASARQYYNACVRDLNTKIESFPSNLAAMTLGVKHAEFFEVETEREREAASLALG